MALSPFSLPFSGVGGGGVTSRYVTVYPDARVAEPVTVREITLAPGIKPHDSPEPFVNLEAFCSDDDSGAETLFV